jgi:sterol desaturase/sphingolipid hydroxylase (fatty acid hydroxylase superfamily)
MLDFLQDVLINVDNGLGAAAWLLALALPFRRFVERPEILLDVAACACMLAFSEAAVALLDVPTDWMSERIDGWYAIVDASPWWLIVPAYVVLADFGAYWAHRLLHTRWLWPTHAWHHSPKHLYWLSGLRASPVHVLVLLAPYFFAFVLFPVPETAIVGTAIVVLDAANQHLIHSNIKVPFVRTLEFLFVTPRFHFVHHNARIELSNSNYGFVFSVWDRWFGTYTDPVSVPDDDPLGLGYEVGTLWLLLGLPPKRGT